MRRDPKFSIMPAAGNRAERMARPAQDQTIWPWRALQASAASKGALMSAGRVRQAKTWPESFEKEVRELLESLPDQHLVCANPLAQALAPVFRAAFPELASLPFERVICGGLHRLWRQTAGQVLIGEGTFQRLNKFFALEVLFLYPAWHGRHRLGLGEDALLSYSEPLTRKEAAIRMARPDYLALIYADGELDKAQTILEKHRGFLEEIGQTQGGAQPEQTFNSRIDKAVEILAKALWKMAPALYAPA
ncbi:MAG: hypothetical protein KA764_18005 [Anaerolineales bacterium]|nr:hypothetical protein [Anaerolineales bacterium]